MTKDIREYTEPKPKKKKTVEELNSWLQDLSRRSKERQIELKKIGVEIQLLYEQLKLDFPEDFKDENIWNNSK